MREKPSSHDIASEMSRVLLGSREFDFRVPDSPEKQLALDVLSACQSAMNSHQYIKFSETADEFKGFLDTIVFDYKHGEKHTFEEISHIIIDVALGEPFTKEKDILLVWNHLDKFSPEVTESLKSSLEHDLRAIIQQEPDFDNGNRTDVFVKGLLKGLANNQKSYPMVLMNKDSSVSIYLDTNWAMDNPPPTEDTYDKVKYPAYSHALIAYNDEKKLNENFSSLFSNPAFIMRLEHAAERHGFKTLNDAPIVEIIPGEDANQFRIHLSPENLDSILKEHTTYVGYKADGSLLSLYPHYDLKPGTMMLSPIALLEGEQYVMRIAGCQLTEVPSVQLFNMLPDHSNEIGHYHWDIKEVSNKLLLNQFTIKAVLDELMLPNGTLKESLDADGGQQGNTVLDMSEPEKKPVHVVPMDEVSKRFYAQFGQCTLEELESCQSLEVDAIVFLQTAARVLDTHLDRRIQIGDLNGIEKVIKSKENLAKLIEIEKERSHTPHSREVSGDSGEWVSRIMSSRSRSSNSHTR